MSAGNYHENIRSAFRAALIAALPGWEEWEWEDEVYEPTLGTPYIRERQVPASSIRTSIGVQEHVTLCMATLFFPSGGGTRAASEPAGKIIEAFSVPRLSLAYGGDKALVTKAEQKGRVIEPKWVSIPIIVTTLGHTIVAV
jgi:hypothetical protein